MVFCVVLRLQWGNMVVLVGVFWIVLGVLLALRFRDMTSISQYELTRLSNHGDKKARELLARMMREPELDSLRQIVVTIISTALVTSSVFAFGLWQGIIMGALLLITAPLLIRVSFVRSLADKLRDLAWPYALKVVDWIGPVLRWLRERDIDRETHRVYSTEELLDVVHRSRGVLSSAETKRLHANLEFDSRMVGDIMTPKSMIVTADVHDTLGPLVMAELHKSGHSRYPVIDGDVDHTVGILYLKELIDLKSEHQTIRAAMDPHVYYIREDQDLEHALHGFLRTHHHLFVVVNEYRETVGLLSLEDTLEALIGSKIVDEFDEFDDLRAVAERNPNRNNRPSGHQNI